MALESSRGELQRWFKPCSNQKSQSGDMSSQSFETPTRDNFRTPPWESREKEPFGCSLSVELQRILYGGRWWLPQSPGRGESSVSKCPWWVKCVQVPVACPNTQRCSRMWTNLLVVGFGCRFKWDNTCPSS
jgi:hypothetical protein